jgi:hypothetical protein
MRRPLLLALCLASGFPVTAAAQVGYYAGVGATWSTDIVRDVILVPITTRPGIAPTLFIGADLPLNGLYRMGLELSAGTASLTTRTPSQPNSNLDQGRITTLGALANLSGQVTPGLRWRAGLGVLHYGGPGDAGIFAQGGTLRALFGAGLDYQLSTGHRWNPVISARYDYHRFSTQELRTQGFGLEQGVQRISVSVGVTRGNR